MRSRVILRDQQSKGEFWVESATAKIRLCPCGVRLERKKGDTEARFEARIYCSTKCMGKYRQRKPTLYFGQPIPEDNTRRRIGRGIQGYLDDEKKGASWE